MPRAKVRPEDRQRSAVACLPCKRAKIRCDSGTPCATCSKRGREASCVYEEALGRSTNRRRRRLSSNANVNLRQGRDTTANNHDGPSPGSSVDGGASTTDDVTKEPQSRMLLSSKLQKVYIGETASLSYLQFLRRVLKHRLGPCAFTDGEFNNFMLENDIASSGNGAFDVLDPNERQILAQVYLDATSGIFDFHSKVEVLSSVNSCNPPIGLATTSLILAIGAQCRGTSSSDLQHASSQFTHGQQLSFDGMLCDPSLDMVRNFLLMAFYMLGACHRNAAFMYLGVASKAASALGLHRSDQYRDLPLDECRARLGTWKSLRVLDTIVNSILGRSSGLPGMLQPDNRFDGVCLRSSKVDEGAREMSLQAIFDMCPFMDELERKVCRQDMASAENFLQRLQKWSKALPEELRTSTEANLVTSISVNREMFIGRTHVACVYYFAVILTTRRFLTLYLLDRLQERTSFDQTSQKPKMDDKTSSLAHVCLNAAVNLAKVGNNIMTSNQMLDNMCLLKAWMFAAGLLLGFSLFAQHSDSANETEAAFHQARAVLRKLAELSLQAGHYYEILTSLSDAIVSFQRKVADERKQMMSQYLDQIFTANAHDEVEDGVQPTNFDTNPGIPTDAGGVLNSAQGLNSNGMTLDNMTTGPYGLMISEGFPWPADDLSFDWQMYEPFFDDAL